MKRLLLLSTLALTLAMGAPAFVQADPPELGAFEALSPGGMKIVDSIYDSHVLSDSHMAMGHIDLDGAMLTTDKIAFMKGDTGWGNVYKQLLANDPSLVTHRNLGQAISSRNHQTMTTTTTTVLTTGTGQKIVVGNKKGQGFGASSVKGGNAGSQGGGKKLGHYKNDVITTGAGGPAVGGPTSHSSAGGASFGGSSFGGAGGSKGRGRGGASHKGK